MAGDPLGDWRPSKDESLAEWAERQSWARRGPEPPEGRFTTVLVIAGVLWTVFVVVYGVVWAIVQGF